MCDNSGQPWMICTACLEAVDGDDTDQACPRCRRVETLEMQEDDNE